MMLRKVLEILSHTSHTSARWKGNPCNGSLALNKTTSELSGILVYAFRSYNCILSVKHFANCCLLSAAILCLREYWFLLLQLSTCS
jgi:hypothetical protein